MVEDEPVWQSAGAGGTTVLVLFTYALDRRTIVDDVTSPSPDGHPAAHEPPP